MKRSQRLAAAFLFLSCLPAYAHHLAVIVHQDNHQRSVTSAELAKIFRAESRKWPNGNNVTVVLNKNSAVTMQVLQRLCKMGKDEMDAFLAAHKSEYLMAGSDAEVVRLVEGTPGALGLVDVREIDGKVTVLKVDGKLPLEKGYLPH